VANHSDAEVEDELAAADAIVLRYRRKGVGRSSVAAAFALGCPTVVAVRRVFRVYLEHGECYPTVPMCSPAHMADATKSACGDNALNQRLSAGARRTSIDVLGWAAIAEKTLSVYREALTTRREVRRDGSITAGE
jgi:glycosyltransferase involved in cell wall biosynthesis